jgi:hypothetical protein
MAKNQVIVSVTSNTKALEKGFGSATDTLSKFGKVAGLMAAAVAVVSVGLGVKAVASASKLEQAMGGMESIFKSSSGQMEKWANAAALSVGLAKSEYAGLSTILGAQLKNMGIPMEKLGAQTNDLVLLGADLAAQFGGTTSDAVASLSSLLRGERDPIEKYGVSIKQADVNARLASKGLGALTGEALKQATTLVTLELLYEQTADAQGAFSRESFTLANAQQKLSAIAENLSATFGTALLPGATAVTAALASLLGLISGSEWFGSLTASVTAASNSFADFIFSIINGEQTLASLDLGQLLIDQFANLSAWLTGGGIQTIFDTLTASREGFLRAMLQALPGITDALVLMLPLVLNALVEFLAEGVTLLAGAAPAIMAAAVVLFSGLVDTVATALPGIIDTIVALVPVLLGVAVELFTTLVEAIPVILPPLLAAIIALLPTLISAVLGMIPQILTAAIQLFNSLVDALPVILPLLITAIVELLPQLLEAIVGMIPQILTAAIDLFMALIEAIPVILPLLINAIVELLPVLLENVLGMLPALLAGAIQLFIALVEAIPVILPLLITAIIELLPVIIGALIGMIPMILQAGVDLIGGLIDGLWDAAGSLGTALIDIAQDAIGGFLSFLGINSPSKLFAGFGGNLGDGLALGINKSGKTVSKALDGMSALVSDGFNATMSAPELSLAVGTGSAAAARAASRGNTYNISLSTLDASPAVGQVIVQAIKDYERAGGRQ